MHDLTDDEAAWMFCTHGAHNDPCERTPVACDDGYPGPEWSGRAWCKVHVPAEEPMPLLGLM